MAADGAAQPILRGRLTAILALVVAALALLSVVAVLGLRAREGSTKATRREHALQAARQLGVNLNTLDYQSGQKDVDRIIAGATGTLRDQLASQTKTLLDQLTKNKAKVTIGNPQAGVVSIDDDSAEVIVSMDYTVTNEKVKNAAARAWRAQMNLERHGDRWLVSDLELVP
ncbi:hypothetical protein [Actinomadura atramentaria]|uniref:hypothetical protein n=1 Tax=Actinomadura atramentaria TaxID=1990 RepID=UPI0003A36D16|nr:hypothetical protein [Actinomadura atramentaria]